MQATPDQLGAYFLWLKDRGLRYPVRAVAEKRKSVQVVFVGDTGFSVPERDLLTKMIGAMQLQGEHVIVDRLEDFPAFVAAYDAQLVIPLGKAAADVCPGDTIPTLHPRDLLARPDDKRIAWNDLKRAMARLKS